MGRRRLLPNINNLLLQLHLPHRSSNNSSSNGSTTKQPEDEDTYHQHHENDHHRHHIFTWPSLKRRPSTSSLASGGTEDDSATESPSSQKSLALASLKDSSSHHRGSSSVSFGTCEVRTYSQVLGDHPCCSEGCPIQLGWKYQTEELMEVDEYESHHQDTVLHELRLTPEERRKILIFAKQQQYVNSNNSGASAACGISDGESCVVELGQESRDSTDHSEPAPAAMSDVQHERELRRECRRLNRCNANVKASRKRNKRTQQAFFGTRIPTPASDAPARSGRE